MPPRGLCTSTGRVALSLTVCARSGCLIGEKSATGELTRPAPVWGVSLQRGKLIKRFFHFAQCFLSLLPLFYFETYHPPSYKGVIPPARHRAISKLARNTNHMERFNCTLRQRVSRPVRSTLSFSKKLANHIGALKYFICNYNLTKGTALPG